MLKICFANVQRGERPESLIKFIRSNPSVGIWCFTEVTNVASSATIPESYWESNCVIRTNHFRELLNEFYGAYSGFYTRNSNHVRTDFLSKQVIGKVQLGNAMFVYEDFSVLTVGSATIFTSSKTEKTMQWTIVGHEGYTYLVAHFHGIWIEENTKGDHPDRLKQSVAVSTRLEELAIEYRANYVILGGDFNLDIDTQALRELVSPIGSVQYRNLIKEFAITDTRTPLYRDYLTGSHYADYVLVSNNTQVLGLEAPAEAFSDHRPLIVTVR